MKKIFGLLIVTGLISFNSCTPKISTSLTKSYPALDYKQDVVVIGLDQEEPANAEVLGQVKIGDTGFSTKCGYDIALDKAKLEARKAGGNAIKITAHTPPSLVSSCHRITARILRLENIESYFTAETKEEILPGVDYAILNVYRYGGTGALISYDLHLGDSVICRVRSNFRTTLHIKKDGLNTLWARTESRSEVPINVIFGKTYYLRCAITMGAMVGRPEIALVDNKTGKAEFESIKPKNQ